MWLLGVAKIGLSAMALKSLKFKHLYRGKGWLNGHD